MSLCADFVSVQLWDVAAGRMIRQMQGHRSRVSSLSWNGSLVSSGSRDSVILHHDVRAPQHQVNNVLHTSTC